MNDLQIRKGYANGTLTDCDSCGATIKMGEEREACADKDEDAPAPVRCDQCVALMINGAFCHETGCPNAGSRYDAETGEFVKQRKCFECGCTVDADNLYCNAENDACDPEEDVCDDCGELSVDCQCYLDEDEPFHEDTDSLEDRGMVLGSYAS